MSGRAPDKRAEPVSTDILVGAPVSSLRHWMPMAATANWLNGCGAQIIPGCVVDRAIPSGAARTLRFRAKTRYNTIEYLWGFLLRSDTAGASVTINTGGSEGTLTYPINSGRDTRLPILHRSFRASQAAAVFDFTATITSVTGIIDIDTVTCTELPRPILAQSASELGVDTNTTRPREKIYSSLTTGESTTGVVTAMFGDHRKSGIYQWAVPDADPVTRSGAYVNLLTLPVPVLTSLLDSADVAGKTARVYWSAYARVNANNGDILLTTTQSAVSDAVSVSNTSFAWTAKRAIEISCEDMSAADGLQSGGWDDLQIQIRGNGGQTLSVATVSLWNEEI